MKNYLCLTDTGLREVSEDELYRIARPIIWKALNRVHPGYRNDHEDLAQIAMMELFGAMARYNPERGEMYPYIKAITWRRIGWEVARIRAEHGRVVSLTESLEAVLPVVPSVDESSMADFEKALTALKDGLTETERQAVDLKLEGASNTEIYNTLHPDENKRRIGQAMTFMWAVIAQKFRRLGEPSNGIY